MGLSGGSGGPRLCIEQKLNLEITEESSCARSPCTIERFGTHVLIKNSYTEKFQS